MNRKIRLSNTLFHILTLMLAAFLLVGNASAQFETATVLGRFWAAWRCTRMLPATRRIAASVRIRRAIILTRRVSRARRLLHRLATRDAISPEATVILISIWACINNSDCRLMKRRGSKFAPSFLICLIERIFKRQIRILRAPLSAQSTAHFRRGRFRWR